MKHEFSILHLFAGIGGGAMGTTASAARFGAHEAHFRNAGGVDFDAQACDDFGRLTGAPALRADLHTLQPAELRAFCPEMPDAVLLSPPCKGFSGLLSKARAAEPKYQAMNRLLLDGLFLLCSTWSSPPPLIFVENVPRIAARGGALLRQVRAMLQSHGYALHDGTHNCGEIGGLAQNRMRWFLVARCQRRVPQFVYQPPHLRVRGCGEVLGALPTPGDASAGPLHALPRITWRNWVRLALIPAGGDWRDLPGVVPAGRRRGSQDHRDAVADPRLEGELALGGRTVENSEQFKGSPGLYGVVDWQRPASTVTGSMSISGSNTPAAVADPRFTNIMPVVGWDAPARTVIGASRVGSGAMSVADPRVGPDWHPSVLGVTAWDRPTGVIAGNSWPMNGRYSVADPRLGCTPRAGAYRVLSWQEAAGTITGSLQLDNGPAAVADPRIPGPATPIDLDLDPDKPPPFTPIIVAPDGTWHRPMTTLELAALQGFPVEVDGAPLALAGAGHTRWREAVGNAIPPPAAAAVGEQLLRALLLSKLGAFALSSNDVWVAPPELS